MIECPYWAGAVGRQDHFISRPKQIRGRGATGGEHGRGGRNRGDIGEKTNSESGEEPNGFPRIDFRCQGRI